MFVLVRPLADRGSITVPLFVIETIPEHPKEVTVKSLVITMSAAKLQALLTRVALFYTSNRLIFRMWAKQKKTQRQESEGGRGLNTKAKF